MNPSKRKGTAAETAVVNFLRGRGWGDVERRTLSGAHDKGDIAGLPVVVEVKDCATMTLAQWVAEANREAENAGQSVGVVWHKRRGKGTPGDWYVTMDGHAFLELLAAYERSGDALS